MSPDAAELFAQVDATLLVALAVQGRPPERPKTPEKPGDPDFSRRLWESSGIEIYSAGLIGTLFSLAMTLASVRYGKALEGWSASIVSGATTLGMLAFFSAALGRAIGSHQHLKQRLRLVLSVLGCMVAYCIWLLTFAPSVLPWK